MWMTKISGMNKQKCKPFYNNGCLGGVKQGAYWLSVLYCALEYARVALFRVHTFCLTMVQDNGTH